MKSIWKYTLDITDDQEVQLPVDVKFLDVQMQHGMPQMWCLVDVDALTIKRHIRIIGTGHSIENDFDGIYIATFQVMVGQTKQVYHVFDMGIVKISLT